MAILLVLVGLTSTRAAFADENANDRTSNNITTKAMQHFGGSKQESLTPDEVFISGVFASNFYQPFISEIYEPGGEVSKKTVEEMAKAFSTTGAYDKDLAKSLAENIVGVSKQSAPLYFGYELNGEIKQLEYGYAPGKQALANGAELLGLAAGHNQKEFKYNEVEGWVQAQKAGATTGVLYHDSPTKSNVVFDFKIGETGKPTASQLAFMESFSLALKDPNAGVLKGFATAKTEEVKKLGDGDGQAKLNKALKDKMDIGAHSIFASKVKVDSFGNILLESGVYTYVIVPAINNPYVYQKVGDAASKGSLKSVFSGQSIALDKDKGYSGRHGYFELTKLTGDKSNLDIFLGVGGGKKYNTAIPFLNTKNDEKFDYAFKCQAAKSYLDGMGIKVDIGTKIDGAGECDWTKFAGTLSNRINGGKGKTGKGNKTIFNMAVPNLQWWVSDSKFKEKSPSFPTVDNIVEIDMAGVNDKFNDDGFNALKVASVFEVEKAQTGGKAPLGKGGVLYSGYTQDYGVRVFTALVVAGTDELQDLKKSLGWELTSDNLPKTGLTGIDLDNSIANDPDAMKGEVLKMTYYFLHPSEGIYYIGQWFHTKATGMLVKVHNEMVGASNSKINTGTTAYKGFTGYVTTPALSDVSWLSWMNNKYLDIGVYLIILCIIIMVIFMAFGELTILQGLKGMVVFAVLLYLPPLVINSAVGVTNQVSDKLFRTKFNYYAVNQLQTYQGKVDDVAKAGTKIEYIESLVALNEADKLQENAGNAITVRWTAPKKDNYLHQVEKELGANGENKVTSKIYNGLLKGMMSNALGGENFQESSDALYVFRSVQDITNYGRYIYGNIMGDQLFNTGPEKRQIADIQTSLNTIGLEKNVLNYITGTGENTLLERKSKGFIPDVKGGIKGGANDSKSLKRIYAPISSNEVSKAALTNVKGSTPGGAKLGLDSKIYDVALAYHNNHKDSLKTLSKTGYSDAELVSASAFSVNSESPYYYFMWGLYDNGFQTKSGSSDQFKKIMLGNNRSYFYNKAMDKNQAGYGDMVDYMDMGSLFHTVIPYLKKVNEPLLEWSQIYGTKPFPGITIDGKSELPSQDSPDYYKYWFNDNLARLFNQYSPWVDLLYSGNFANPTTINYAGQKQEVKDPLDPSSYTIRPMVFSEAEANYYGIKDKDLTAVESKIIKINKETYKDLEYLLNYYAYDDTTLVSAMAMLMTFNFNSEFTQNNFLGESFTQYPQSYELKDFSYDGFLRLILAQNSNEDLLADGKDTIYETVIQKAGIFTGILMIICAALGAILVPVMKIATVVLLFVLLVIIVLSRGYQGELTISKLVKSVFLKPLLIFLGTTVGFSLIIAAMVGQGYSGVTGDLGFNVSFGSPTFAVLVLIALNSILVVIYFFLIKMLGRAVKDETQQFTNAIKVVAETATDGAKNVAGVGVGGAKEGWSKVRNFTGGAVESGTTGKRKRGKRNLNVDDRGKENTDRENLRDMQGNVDADNPLDRERLDKLNENMRKGKADSQKRLDAKKAELDKKRKAREEEQ